jgi:pyruvate-formate lyase
MAAEIKKEELTGVMSFRVVVYPSEFDRNYFTAHCLELDVIGQDKTIEGSIAQLLEAIETQLATCVETGAQFEFWAPGLVWYKYEQARKANRKIPDEMMERIIKQANQRLGYQSPINLDTIAAGTQEVFDECQAAFV